MAIKRLSEQLASQIAAGEVVERPASVVKELVENAIDAKATTINVDIKEGGRKLIQIADNGSGIPADQVKIAFERHATSKLDSVDSLNAIATLGFRGEALAAISSVSHLTIVTRDSESSGGTRLVMHGGIVETDEQVGAPVGTVIAVENLFYNTPARLKFLKSETSEKRAIDEIITKMAMAYPHIRFRLTHNNRLTFQTNGTGELRDTLTTVYGVEISRQLLELTTDDGQQTTEDGTQIVHRPSSDVHVTGFVAPPSIHRNNRAHITLFVNGRWVKDKNITYAVVQAYHTLLPIGRYPLAIIFIELPLEDVDVNVHPTKTEVRFKDQNKVFGAVQRTIRETLLDHVPVRAVTDSPFQPVGQTSPNPWFQIPETNGSTQNQFDLSPRTQYQPLTPSDQPPPPANLGGEKLPIMRVVGQIRSAYIITEGPEGMYLIDQHAAHERILYEKFLSEWKDENIPYQTLLASANVHLTPSQAQLVQDNMATLQAFGFEVESFGPQSFVIRSVPTIMAKGDPAQALQGVIADLERDRNPLVDTVEQLIIKRVCKTASIKAGQTLTRPEMDALVQQLEASESPHTCPHGRPTMIHLSLGQLAREFGRL